MAGSLDATAPVAADTPSPLVGGAATRDDMLLLTQSRGPAAWSALACAVFAATGAALAMTTPARSIAWWLGAGAAVAAMAGGALALAWVLRPARLTVGADGIDLWQVFGARSMVWEELAAIGHSRTRRARGEVLGASGVRIVLLDGTGIDLPAGWGMDDDELIELLTDAWQGFTAPDLPAPEPPVEQAQDQPQLVV
jgi:hypothetical protein